MHRFLKQFINEIIKTVGNCYSNPLKFNLFVILNTAKTFLEIAEIENAGHFAELVAKSDLTNELNNLKNVTVFLPTNEATEVSELFMQIHLCTRVCAHTHIHLPKNVYSYQCTLLIREIILA